MGIIRIEKLDSGFKLDSGQIIYGVKVFSRIFFLYGEACYYPTNQAVTNNDGSIKYILFVDKFGAEIPEKLSKQFYNWNIINSYASKEEENL